jgi:transposase
MAHRSVRRRSPSITDKVIEEMNEWQHRPLDDVYAAIFIDVIVVKIRDGQVGNRPIYAAIGVTLDGEKDVLGLWAGTGGQGAKFWMSVLTDIKNRGVKDTFFLVCDGLKGLPEVVGNLWPLTIVQTCIIHLIRNTFRLASKKDWNALKRDVKPIYTAANSTAARAALEELTKKWGKRYAAIIRLLRERVGRVHPVPGLWSLLQNACRRGCLVAGLRELFMAKAYRLVLRDQVFLLPPDVRDWLPADHLAWFILESIEALETSEFDRNRRRGGPGVAGYDPRMLLGLLIYAYCRGVRSSRQIERLCHTDIAFRVLCAQDVPDHCTLARFRAECQEAFTGLFTQVLMIAGRAGLGQFGTVAIDGTKIAAAASIDANRGHEWLSEQVERILTEAEATDATEDKRAAARELDGDSDRMSGPLIEGSERATRIRQAAAEVAALVKRKQKDEDLQTAAAKARLVKSRAGEPVVGRIPEGPHRLAEAQAHLARELQAQQSRLDRRAALLAAGKKPMGAPPVPLEQQSRVIRAREVVKAAIAAEQQSAAKKIDTRPLPKTVANITDPQSRLMPTRRGFLQGYNAQLAVTGDQIIAAVQISQSSNLTRATSSDWLRR